MEKINTIVKNITLRKAFISAVALTVIIIFILSALSIYLCLLFQNIILPDSDAVYLHVVTTYEDGTVSDSTQRFLFNQEESLSQLIPEESDSEVKTASITKYSVEKVVSSFESLPSKQKALYTALSAAMLILPLLYSIIAVGLCGIWFYRNKLAPPIKILSEATEYIGKQDLDFSVKYDSHDEMGKLCASFEKMRIALYENNQALWKTLEDRKQLQASVAHDLRNPISIIECYIEYLQKNIPEGNISEERLLQTLNNLQAAAKRMEQYTDSIRDICTLEELEVNPTPTLLSTFLSELIDDFMMIAKQDNLLLIAHCEVPNIEVQLDKQLYYRILENIISNATRYAKEKIYLDFSMENKTLFTTISDDGDGFSDEILNTKGNFALPYINSSHHLGMGICVSKILSKRLGGDLILYSESSTGAVVKITTAL